MTTGLPPALGRFAPAPITLKSLKLNTPVNLGTGGTATYESRMNRGAYELRFNIVVGEGASDDGGNWYLEMPDRTQGTIPAMGYGLLKIPGVNGEFDIVPYSSPGSNRVYIKAPLSLVERSYEYFRSWDGTTPGNLATPSVSGHPPNKAGVTLAGYISIPPPSSLNDSRLRRITRRIAGWWR